VPQVYAGDCREVMDGLPASSYTAIVCDPPYGLSFMGRAWDFQVPGPDYWRKACRVLKPGGLLFAFGGTRTFHHLTAAIEKAGLELADTICWLYGSGFPKGHNISHAIDAHLGHERPVVGTKVGSSPGQATSFQSGCQSAKNDGREYDVTGPASPEAAAWEGMNTALKPAWEPILVARKPLDGTFATNALKHGCGGMNIGNTRIGDEEITTHGPAASHVTFKGYAGPVNPVRVLHHRPGFEGNTHTGRWPPNVVLDEESARQLDEQHPSADGLPYSRFFYCGKASATERDKGLTTPHRQAGALSCSIDGSLGGHAPTQDRRNHHPTVKPIAVMKYCCSLARMPGDDATRILDPFCGSGSTLVAAALMGLHADGIETDPDFVTLATQRQADALARGAYKQEALF